MTQPRSQPPTSSQAPSPPPSPPRKPGQGAVPQTIRDLIFTLVVPIAVLSPNLLGSGFSVADQLGGGTQGNVRAYLAAALIPVVYVAWDLIRNRNVSPVALLGGAGALVGGALAFWYVDGFWYAVKDSARSYLLGLAFLISAGTRVPLFRIFMDAASLNESPDKRALTQQAMDDPQIHRALANATVVFALVDILSGLLNSFVNYQRVTAEFGSDAFNAQVAEVNAIMRLPSFGISLLGVGIAFWLLHRATVARFGPGASLLEPGSLAGRVGQLAPPAPPTPGQAD
ncbi:VC0807 family protein [Deinococcus sp. Marseille-Q6407]|uniref:VC0807 family protein n=1 Tax=Deinococcus sp. Marseille-Q6407 TaxID=2969223 RepID=UPI0021C151FD|nr:VC0807 family protein [Deinococcus sp. Marseille-Q6407]